MTNKSKQEAYAWRRFFVTFGQLMRALHAYIVYGVWCYFLGEMGEMGDRPRLGWVHFSYLFLQMGTINISFMELPSDPFYMEPERVPLKGEWPNQDPPPLYVRFHVKRVGGQYFVQH